MFIPSHLFSNIRIYSQIQKWLHVDCISVQKVAYVAIITVTSGIFQILNFEQGRQYHDDEKVSKLFLSVVVGLCPSSNVPAGNCGWSLLVSFVAHLP
jgi:hypothetical protein